MNYREHEPNARPVIAALLSDASNHRKIIMGIWNFTVLGILPLVTSCTAKAPDRSSPEKGTLPPEVLAAVDTTDSPYGQFNSMSHGKFIINKGTSVCRATRMVHAEYKGFSPRMLGPDLRPSSEAQSSKLSGNLNESFIKDNVCADDGINIVSFWRLVPNRNGRPYSLTLAVWQGSSTKRLAYWVGTIARIDGRRDDLSIAWPGGIEPTKKDIQVREWQVSLERDANDVSQKFMNEYRTTSGDGR
jgi:hypothetical protein